MSDAVLEAVEGDITTQQVDAIVNAANSSLLGGGGVDGAIHAAAGPALLAECRELRQTRYAGGLPVGAAVATGAGNLPATWVIHTVGPNRHAGQTDPGLLASCFRSSLGEAGRVGARTVAFPAISAGIYGWDRHDVAEIAVATTRRALEAGVVPTPDGEVDLSGIELVRFVLFGRSVYDAFQRQLT
ncbi:MAG TPA: O-acetyl-ADP-ribose deacetylase [Segeticoccus sp.]|uniref:O-acetyl-ADP-ribose deacetylase n=1 Tax=Segeticoccus sp. TaxID=2706531 RepID=UPI002D80DB76|nr:O-acetyl-ADP-ribose deacetylase [Segeticoccus sp.]HET8599998.1 O-acetyl-ADP-ribose deacetylase [Segeticoccus sp.]